MIRHTPQKRPQPVSGGYPADQKLRLFLNAPQNIPDMDQLHIANRRM